MYKNIKKFAFTLAEIMVVLAIVTCVVAVSVKISKSKFDSANRYLYYSAFDNLKQLTAEAHLDVNSATVTCTCADGSKSIGTNNADCQSRCNGAMPTWFPLSSTAGEFCLLLSEFANLKSNTSICTGSSSADVNNVVNSESKEFFALVPDLIFRNGVKLYNVQTSAVIPLFANSTVKNEEGTTNIGQTTALRQGGFTVYADIDGDRNNGILWEDVFPFYITLNGYVIPAFRVDGLGGANNLSEIQASVLYDNIVAGNIHQKWLLKGVTYQRAACESGFIDGGTYCTGFNISNTCIKSATNFANCSVKIIAPLRF